MKNRRFNICILLFLFSIVSINLVIGQDKRQKDIPKTILKGKDPLDRFYYPTLAVLPLQNFSNVNSDILKYLNITFKQGLEGNAYTPYGVVLKDKFYAVKDYVTGMNRADFRKYYFYESVPCEYMVNTNLNSFQIFRPESFLISDNGIISPTICKANFAIDFIDVSTSSILISKNLWLTTYSKPNSLYNPAADSASAVNEMYKEIKNIGKPFFQKIAGIGSIDSMLEIKKEKAIVVATNPVQIITTRNKSENFNVYALIKKYSSDNYYFNQTEKIGLISKKNYSVRTNNMEVEDGEKEIFKSYNDKIPLLVSYGDLPPTNKPATLKMPSIMIDTFQSMVNTLAIPALYQAELTELLSERSQFFNIVNRTAFNNIEIEKSIQKQLKEDVLMAGVTRGADFILQAKIISSNFSRIIPKTILNGNNTAEALKLISSKPEVKNQNKPKLGEKQAAKPSSEPPPPEEVEYSLSSNIEFSLISVETGAIVWTKNLKHDYNRKYLKEKSNYYVKLNTSTFINEAISDFCNRNVFRISAAIFNKYPILSCERDKKGKPKTLLMGGGIYAGITGRFNMQLIYENEIVVDGKKLKREEVIGSIQARHTYPEVSEWKIMEGEEVLDQLLKKDIKVYGKFIFD